MIILMKERRETKRKNYYMTICAGCLSKFAFSEDDMDGIYDHESIVCPVCSERIPHYITSVKGVTLSYFKTISRRKYNWLMKRYGTKNTDEGDDIK